MNPGIIERDERTLAVENASFRLGYLVLSFGLLADVAWRSWVRGATSWDLLGLVLLAGLVTTGYQVARRVVLRRGVILTAVAMVVAAALAAALVVFT